MTSRERVQKTLLFDLPDRIPRDLWTLPAGSSLYPEEISRLMRCFPTDFEWTPRLHRKTIREKGDPYSTGGYTDEWGCIFTNVHGGIIGEVRDPLIKAISDANNYELPYDILPGNFYDARKIINQFCADTDKFVVVSEFPRVWERYQFLRGTANALMDSMYPNDGFLDLVMRIHTFYLEEFTFYASTDVDALFLMDDWGSQRQLLVNPDVWRKHFKPIYQEYCNIAKANGKYVFMHSDGCIQEIYPDLVEIGIDAINSQLSVMDLDVLNQVAKGRITFWGEIDRQHILSSGDPAKGKHAVRTIAEKLYDPSGGIIAQFEFGPGATPAVARAVFDEWDKIHNEHLRSINTY